ncbi:hypothetical protein RND71_005530 [Anisodus tanguticus]|uniref:Chitinase n=1 Tax=Anisodus tanguticus TaxID=243964 RepID=A0AAE1SSL2_9SOLA|nr:hypothetical protein RND71_005530 [Anisodus tanguticus]
MAPMTNIFSIIFSYFFLQQLIYFSNGQIIVKAGYWVSDRGLGLNNINSTLFTHLFCAFADLNNQSNQLIISPENQESFQQFTSTVLQKNPSVKTLLSIGGGRANKTSYGVMARTSNSRKSFIDSSIKLARQLGFHGLDLGWQYPESATDMTNLDTLLNEWRTTINKEVRNSNNATLLFTATVSSSSSPYENKLSYPIQSVAKNLDWINLMAYEFYGPNWSPSQTNSHAQLFDPVKDISGSDGINQWIQAGVPARKLVLGIPFYGFAWQLVNSNIHGLRAPALGKSNVSSADDGSMTYGKIRDYIVQSRATKVYNATIVGDYCYSGSSWISYDDTQSVRNKVTYVKGRGLLGYFAWHVAADQNWVLSHAASQVELGRKPRNKMGSKSKSRKGGDNNNLQVFSFNEMKEATNNFSFDNKLGQGGYGPVYKISDFGMARMFKEDEVEANTSRVAGTVGYIPPEYAEQGIYSTKSDVFSFGVLLLQIISGKKNTCLHGPDENLNLLEYAFETWKDGKGMEFMDESLDDTTSSCKLLNCMQIALLCVQKYPSDRPTMLGVSNMMKNNANIAMNSPKRPAFSTREDEEGENVKGKVQEIEVDTATITQLVAR